MHHGVTEINWKKINNIGINKKKVSYLEVYKLFVLLITYLPIKKPFLIQN